MKLKTDAFNGQLLDLKTSEQINANLRKEQFYKPGNIRLLSNWLFTRDFLGKMLKMGGKDFTLKGSSSLTAYMDAYRLPTDIDIETEKLQEVEDLVRQVVAQEQDIEYKLIEEEPYCGSIRQKNVLARKSGLRAKIGIDIMRDARHADMDGVLHSVLAGDGGDLNANVPLPEKIVGDKMNRILQVSATYSDRCAQPKDFVDIYHLAQKEGFDRELAQDFLREKLMECDIMLMSMHRNTRDNLPFLVHPHLAKMWVEYAKKNVMPGNETVTAVEQFTTGLIAEMEF